MIAMSELVAISLGEPVKSSGRWSWWNCPFHEDRHPSFGATDENAYCFSCKRSFRPISFLVEVMHWTRDAALNYAGVPMPPPRQVFELPPLPPSASWQDVFLPLVVGAEECITSSVGAPGRRELLRRGISAETWARYRVGYRTDWLEVYDTKLAEGIVFPCFVNGQLWSINVRTWSNRIRYHRPRGGAPIVPYGIDQLRGHPILILAEGEMDTLVVAQVVGSIADVIGLRGAANRLDDWLDWFMDYERIIIALDGDEAGVTTAAMLREEHPLWENRQPPVDSDDLCKLYIANYDLKSFLLEGELQCVLPAL